ncbi:hypothetical protein ACTFIW_004333 [Dictyostelium discoideum]
MFKIPETTINCPFCDEKCPYNMFKKHLIQKNDDRLGCFINLMGSLNLNEDFVPIDTYNDLFKQFESLKRDLDLKIISNDQLTDKVNKLKKRKLFNDDKSTYSSSSSLHSSTSLTPVKKEEDYTFLKEQINSIVLESTGSQLEQVLPSIQQHIVQEQLKINQPPTPHSQLDLSFSKFNFNYDDDNCFLNQMITVQLDDGTNFEKMFCTSNTTTTKNLRVDLWNGERNIVLCKVSHMCSTENQKAIRKVLRFPLGMDSVKTKPSNFNKQSCSHCSEICGYDIRAKPSGLSNTDQSFHFFCCVNCLLLFFANKNSTKAWKLYYDEKNEKENKNNEISKLLKKSESKASNEDSEPNDNDDENDDDDDENDIDSTQDTSKSIPKKPSAKVTKKKPAILNNIFKNYPDQIKKFIGLTSVNFEKLFLMIKSDLGEKEKKNCYYNLRGRIFITLFYFRHYPKDIIIEYIFKISRNTLKNYLNEIIDIFYQLSQKSFFNYLKSKEEYYKVYKDRFNKNIRVYSVCDGSEQRIISPLDKKAKIIFFSGKKGYFSINKLVYCLPNGKIIHMAESRPGARSDQGLVHEDTGFFNNFNVTNQYIMGDKGFLGSDKVYSKFIIPEFDKPNKNIDIEVKESMKRFKSIRIIIENVFAHIKKWSITTHIFRHKTEHICQYHHKIWCSVGFLVNTFVEIRPEIK